MKLCCRSLRSTLGACKCNVEHRRRRASQSGLSAQYTHHDENLVVGSITRKKVGSEFYDLHERYFITIVSKTMRTVSASTCCVKVTQTQRTRTGMHSNTAGRLKKAQSEQENRPCMLISPASHCLTQANRVTFAGYLFRHLCTVDLLTPSRRAH